MAELHQTLGRIVSQHMAAVAFTLSVMGGTTPMSTEVSLVVDLLL